MKSKELQTIVRKHVISEGKNGVAKLALSSGVSTRLIEEIIRKQHRPKESNILAILRVIDYSRAQEFLKKG